MNIEKYKREMSRNYPDKKFVEDTLEAIKNNRHTSKINKMQILKTAGGIGLTAAMLAGAVIGGGAVRSLFENIEPINTEPVDTTVPIVSEDSDEPVITDPIIANDNELLATPLASNPKYTVKATTPEGKVSLAEDTPIETLMACGVSLVGDNGFIGVQYFCEAIRKDMRGESLEFIIADKYEKNDSTNYTNYTYLEAENFYTTERKYYEYIGHLSITTTTPYSNSAPFACYGKYDTGRYGHINGFMYTAGYSISSINVPLGYLHKPNIVSLYNILETVNGNIELYKSDVYNRLSQPTEYNSAFLSLIYNGECKGAFRMNKFIENVENGEEYAGVQFTDISTGNDYLERLYSIEYVNGIYSVFTMTDGIFGEFDTQYFDSYTVDGLTVTFDNGTVSYSFPLSEDPEADIAEYSKHEYFNPQFDYLNDGQRITDFYTVDVKLSNFDVTPYLVKEESLSGNGKVAFKVDSFVKQDDINNVYITLKVDIPTLITKYPFTSSTGVPCRIEKVTIDMPMDKCELVPYKETSGGNFYACILDEDFFKETYFYSTTDTEKYRYTDDYICLVHVYYIAHPRID